MDLPRDEAIALSFRVTKQIRATSQVSAGKPEIIQASLEPLLSFNALAAPTFVVGASEGGSHG
jgi:hypothetical protein